MRITKVVFEGKDAKVYLENGQPLTGLTRVSASKYQDELSEVTLDVEITPVKSIKTFVNQNTWEVRDLHTQQEVDRFFENRDPDEWNEWHEGKI